MVVTDLPGTVAREQNARTIWGQYYPGFTDRERRLHSRGDLLAAIDRTRALVIDGTRTFRYPRGSTAP